MKTTRTQSNIPPIMVKSTFVCKIMFNEREKLKLNYDGKKTLKKASRKLINTTENIKKTYPTSQIFTTWKAKMVREKTMMVVIPAAMITASVSYFMLTCYNNVRGK